ncbi:MAG TPA: DUF3006 domain-containing protein [Ruminococcaceae bacterium]|nr:DUF3006 domain-containing protein [Oscillospiraceae bacterium]
MYIIDRFEGDFAVCEAEDLTMTDIPRSLLPAGAKRGSVLIKDAAGIYRLDLDEEKRRKNKIRDLESRIFGEDI